MAHSLHATLLRPAAAWARQAARPSLVLLAPAAVAQRASSSSAPASAPAAGALAPSDAAAAPVKRKPGRPRGANYKPPRAEPPSRTAWIPAAMEEARAIYAARPHWQYPLQFLEKERERRNLRAQSGNAASPPMRLTPEELDMLAEWGMPRHKRTRGPDIAYFEALQRTDYDTERIIQLLRYWDANKRSTPPGLEYSNGVVGRTPFFSPDFPLPAPPLHDPLPSDSNDGFPEHMPGFDKWRHTLEAKITGFLGKGRYFVRSRPLAERIIKELDIEDKKGITVVEAYAGVGSVTRLLLDHPAVEKVIAMEDNPTMIPYLESLKTDTTLLRGPPGDRLHIEKSNAYRWSTYDHMLQAGALEHLHGRMSGDTMKAELNMEPGGSPVLSHDSPDWQEPAPLIFLAHMPNSVHGEQLFAQLVGAVASRSWLFQFGRVKMVVLCSESLALRATAPQMSKHRHRLGVITQALTDVTQVVHPSEMMPLTSHIWPCYTNNGLYGAESLSALERDRQGGSRQHTSDHRFRRALLVVEPKVTPLVQRREMEAFEHVVRNVFVLRSQAVKNAMHHLAPGAINVLNKLHPDNPDMQERQDEAIHPDTPVWSLSIKQWVALCKTFDKWPFRPKMLLDEYSVYKERLAGATSKT